MHAAKWTCERGTWKKAIGVGKGCGSSATTRCQVNELNDEVLEWVPSYSPLQDKISVQVLLPSALQRRPALELPCAAIPPQGESARCCQAVAGGSRPDPASIPGATAPEADGAPSLAGGAVTSAVQGSGGAPLPQAAPQQPSAPPCKASLLSGTGACQGAEPDTPGLTGASATGGRPGSLPAAPAAPAAPEAAPTDAATTATTASFPPEAPSTPRGANRPCRDSPAIPHAARSHAHQAPCPLAHGGGLIEGEGSSGGVSSSKTQRGLAWADYPVTEDESCKLAPIPPFPSLQEHQHMNAFAALASSDAGAESEGAPSASSVGSTSSHSIPSHVTPQQAADRGTWHQVQRRHKHRYMHDTIPEVPQKLDVPQKLIVPQKSSAPQKSIMPQKSMLPQKSMVSRNPIPSPDSRVREILVQANVVSLDQLLAQARQFTLLYRSALTPSEKSTVKLMLRKKLEFIQSIQLLSEQEPDA